MNPIAARTLVIAPPPTPNGGLHLGHLSGPYLAADIVSRSLMMQGDEVFSAISTDDFQTYVDVRARKLGCSSDELLARAQADIEDTIDRYSLGFGELGRCDDTYCEFIAGFFDKALDAGLCEIAESIAAIDPASGAYLNGPELPGYCSRCFTPACETICESCGEPNSGYDLLDPGLGGPVSFRKEERLVVDLERFRGGLTDWLNSCDIQCPKLRANLQFWLGRPLGRRALSRKGCERGVRAPLGLPGQTIDPWAEMYPGHFHHLAAKAGRIAPGDRYLQFLGFDNGYFYTILHGVLAVVGRQCGYDWPRPDALVVNRFYNLGNSKFSTSQGHAIWANDFAEKHDTDLIRFYLALHGPEFDEASFVEELAADSIARIAGVIDRIAGAYNQWDKRDGSQADSPYRGLAAPGPTTGLSMKSLARRALSKLDLLDAMLRQGRAVEVAALAPDLFTGDLAPIMPRFSAQARRHLPERLPSIGVAEELVAAECMA